MTEYKLVGHSGCELRISQESGVLAVIKTSRDTEYNIRLQKQCEKQRASKIPAFKIPTVREEGMKDGLFSFRMDYISGTTLAEHIRTISISEIEQLTSHFVSLVPKYIVFDPNAPAIFGLKIESLAASIKDPSTAVSESLDILRAFSWEYCSKSSCHGDMTLENIIVREGELYLIDFLDSFYDSWQIDIAKLFQDAECFWSYRHSHVDENLSLRLLIFKQYILNTILKNKNGKEIVSTIYHILLLNLLRIIPYAKDSETSDFISAHLVRLNKKLRNNNLWQH